MNRGRSKRQSGPDDSFEKLLSAIVADDVASIEALVKAQPQLVLARAPAPKLYNSPALAHWFYAGDTALHLAAAGHRPAITRALLRAGADPNAAHNRRRSRPLHYTADGSPGSPTYNPRHQAETIRHLLKAGADRNAPDKNGATPLHRAVRTRSAAAVEVLLSAGANHQARNLPGATPFHLAVQNTGRGGSGHPAAIANQRRIIQLLLASGASPALKDASGKSVTN